MGCAVGDVCLNAVVPLRKRKMIRSFRTAIEDSHTGTPRPDGCHQTAVRIRGIIDFTR